jgi:hypothetical protein
VPISEGIVEVNMAGNYLLPNSIKPAPMIELQQLTFSCGQAEKGWRNLD